jgi:hypothetical protein
VTGDCHAGICGSPGVRFPRATRPTDLMCASVEKRKVPSELG